MNAFSIEAKQENIRYAVKNIEDVLSRKDLPSKDKKKAILASEEILVKMIENAADHARLFVAIKGHFGDLTIIMKCQGREISFTDISDRLYFESLKDETDDTFNEVISHLFEKVLGDNLSVRYSKGVNKLTYAVKNSSMQLLIYTIAALILGIVTGYLMQLFVPGHISAMISDNLFFSVTTLFMNALKLIVGPLVFCSVAASISDFGDIKALGRIAT